MDFQNLLTCGKKRTRIKGEVLHWCFKVHNSSCFSRRCLMSQREGCGGDGVGRSPAVVEGGAINVELLCDVSITAGAIFLVQIATVALFWCDWSVRDMEQ